MPKALVKAYGVLVAEVPLTAGALEVDVCPWAGGALDGAGGPVAGSDVHRDREIAWEGVSEEGQNRGRQLHLNLHVRDHSHDRVLGLPSSPLLRPEPCLLPQSRTMLPSLDQGRVSLSALPCLHTPCPGPLTLPASHQRSCCHCPGSRCFGPGDTGPAGTSPGCSPPGGSPRRSSTWRR